MQKLRADFGRRLEYWFNGSDTTGGKLVHFGTSRTILPLYQIEKEKLIMNGSIRKNGTRL